MIKEISPVSINPHRRRFPLVDKFPKKLRKPVYGLITAVTLGGVSAAGAVCNGDSGKDWYYTNGPHADGLSAGQKYAVDIAPEKIVACPGGQPVADQMFSAPIEGVIAKVGNEKDPSDKNHSIVLEKLNDGSFLGFMHLAGVKVAVGQTVSVGDELGAPSCEVPPGGNTTGAHVHVFRLDKNGNPLPVAGMEISGWHVNADGTLSKVGEKTRNADTRRCGPDEMSSAACGGIRNDIPKVEQIVVNGQVISGPQEMPTNTQDAYKTPTRGQEISQKKQEALNMANRFISLMLSGVDADIEQALQMEVPLDKKDAQYEHAGKYDKSEYGGPFRGYQDLKTCSFQMKAGDFRNWKFNIWSVPRENLTQTEILNKQRGLSGPDRYSIGVDFTFRDFNRNYPGHRAPFRDFTAQNSMTYMDFEDVGGKLYLAKNELCFGGPLQIVVGQPELSD